MVTVPAVILATDEGLCRDYYDFHHKGCPYTSQPERHIRDDGLETIAILIPWGDFTDKEIGNEMRKFARTHRPRNHNCDEPKRKGQRPDDATRSDLKALSVMRIWKLHRNKQWKRLDLVAKVCCFRGCVTESRAYKARCGEGRGDEPMSKRAKTEMAKARARARRFFRAYFLGEPSNW